MCPLNDTTAGSLAASLPEHLQALPCGGVETLCQGGGRGCPHGNGDTDTGDGGHWPGVGSADPPPIFPCFPKDTRLKGTIYRIRGSNPASSYLQLPRAGTQSLGLTGRYLYLLFRPLPHKHFLVHLDVTTEVCDTGWPLKLPSWGIEGLGMALGGCRTWLLFAAGGRWFPSWWHLSCSQGMWRGQETGPHAFSPLQHFPAKATRVTKAPCVCLFPRKTKWFASPSPTSSRNSNSRPPGSSSPLSVEQPARARPGGVRRWGWAATPPPK